MDPKLFQQRLLELAELEYIKSSQHGNHRPRRSDQEVYRNGDTMCIDHMHNPTLTCQVRRLKTQSQPCPDCQNMVKDRCVERILYHYPLKHWRERCRGCDLVKNPRTGEFDIPVKRAHSFFVSYFHKGDK